MECYIFMAYNFDIEMLRQICCNYQFRELQKLFDLNE